MFNQLRRRHRGAGFVLAAVLLSIVTFAGCGKPFSVTLESKTNAPLRMVSNPAAITPVCFHESDQDRDLRLALEQPVELQFSGVKLGDALRFVADKYHLPLLRNEAVTTNAGIDFDRLVDAPAGSQPLRIGLGNLLKPHGLVAVVSDGSVWITTPNDLASYRQIRIYPVDDLVIPANDPTAFPDFNSLLEIISGSIEPESWQENGGVLGSLQPYEGNGIVAIVVGHTPEVQEKVVHFLTALRDGRSKAVQDLQAKRSQAAVNLAPNGASRGSTVGGGCFGY